jgi:hypothetical protein
MFNLFQQCFVTKGYFGYNEPFCKNTLLGDWLDFYIQIYEFLFSLIPACLLLLTIIIIYCYFIWKLGNYFKRTFISRSSQLDVDNWCDDFSYDLHNLFNENNEVSTTKISIYLNNIRCDVILDSGGTTSCVDSNFVSNFCKKLSISNDFTCYTKIGDLNILGEIILTVKIESIMVNHKFLVVQNLGATALLSADFLYQQKASICYHKRRFFIKNESTNML